ncbi:MAG: SusD/RagB family nutrient-binding outer membrane lipoprotein [Alistipes sp.]|nr:SusD/RagB family nutrient-binding outer membrane lipoprotein [Alistipes sp.]
MKKTVKYILGLVALVSVAGCTDKFEEYNTNPYEPSTLPLAGFIPGMIEAMSSPVEEFCQRNNVMWGQYGGYFTAPSSWAGKSGWGIFNIDDSSVGFTTKNLYETLYPNWFSVKRLTEGEGFIYQLSQVMRVYSMTIVASTQGPLPYTQVADGVFYVPYDSEEVAWHAMFDDLDAAIAELQNAAMSSSSPLDSSTDRVYGGSAAKWLKFANTLKLRMAIRISSADAAFAKQKAEEAVAAGVMTAVEDSAYDAYHLNGYYQNGTGSYHELAANACIVSYMNGYEDPRRAKYFTPMSDGSYLGLRMGNASITKDNFAGYESTVSGLIFNNLPSAPMPLMYAAEAAFLRAEGALKGWAMGATAEELYNEGIRLSFAQWGASGADEYLANETLKPANHSGDNSVTNKSTCTIKWSDSDSDEKKLEKIITQKWIANFPMGLEAWCDFRRTGYPYIFPPKDNRSTYGVDSERGMRRIRFGKDEYDNNSANVRAAISLLSNGSDSDNTELWWALKGKVKKY